MNSFTHWLSFSRILKTLPCLFPYSFEAKHWTVSFSHVRIPIPKLFWNCIIGSTVMARQNWSLPNKRILLGNSLTQGAHKYLNIQIKWPKNIICICGSFSIRIFLDIRSIRSWESDYIQIFVWSIPGHPNLFGYFLWPISWAVP